MPVAELVLVQSLQVLAALPACVRMVWPVQARSKSSFG